MEFDDEVRRRRSYASSDDTYSFLFEDNTFLLMLRGAAVTRFVSRIEKSLIACRRHALKSWRV
jgi:hypothetical protein